LLLTTKHVKLSTGYDKKQSMKSLQLFLQSDYSMHFQFPLVNTYSHYCKTAMQTRYFISELYRLYLHTMTSSVSTYYKGFKDCGYIVILLNENK
jgi:hypothetical protein